MVDPAPPPPRERWLRVVRDDEATPDHPADPPPTGAAGAPDGDGPPRPREPRPGGPSPLAGPMGSVSAPTGPAWGSAGGLDHAPASLGGPGSPGVAGATPAGDGRGAVPGDGRGAVPGDGRGAVPGDGRGGARVDGPGGAGVGAGRREGARGWPGRVGWVWTGSAVGTGTAFGLDHLLGGLDGRPPLHLLVLFGLPLWDRLPARPLRRLAVLALVVAAVAATWFGLATLRPEPWWRAEVAFGLACALVGTGHAVGTRRRTVDP